LSFFFSFSYDNSFVFACIIAYYCNTLHTPSRRVTHIYIVTYTSFSAFFFLFPFSFFFLFLTAYRPTTSFWFRLVVQLLCWLTTSPISLYSLIVHTSVGSVTFARHE
jgi:hypothetical protein